MSTINVTASHFAARGDGSTDDTCAIQHALDVATDGDVVYFPKGEYKVTAPLRVSDIDVTIHGDSPEASKIFAASPGSIEELLRIQGEAKRGNYLKLGNLRLDGAGRATNVLRLVGAFNYRSRIHDLYVELPAQKGIALEGRFISAGFDNVSVAGGHYGIYCDDTVRLNAAYFKSLRITNTIKAAFFLRNPKPSSLHHYSLYDPTFEGNRGPAIDLMGGAMLRIFGGHFEHNAKNSKDADILMGRYSDVTTAICHVQLFGTVFSSGSTKDNVRVKFQQNGARLMLNGVFLTAAMRVDMDRFRSGCRIYTVMPASEFNVIVKPGGPVSPPEFSIGQVGSFL